MNVYPRILSLEDGRQVATWLSDVEPTYGEIVDLATINSDVRGKACFRSPAYNSDSSGRHAAPYTCVGEIVGPLHDGRSRRS